jgi:hypothetical protein
MSLGISAGYSDIYRRDATDFNNYSHYLISCDNQVSGLPFSSFD